MKERGNKGFSQECTGVYSSLENHGMWKNTSAATVSHLEGLIRNRAATGCGTGPSELWSDPRLLLGLTSHVATFAKTHFLAPRLKSGVPRSKAQMKRTLSGSAVGAVSETGTGAGWGITTAPKAFVGDLFQHKRGGMREIKKDREWREEIKANR